MKVRDARVADAETICGLISHYAELDRMLFRSVSDIYESLQVFTVAETDDGSVVGCCALQVIWADLAEIKSLAVKEGCFGKGIGRGLVEGAVDRAGQLGIPRIFTLTLEPGFFEKLGFEQVDKQSLPMKVWSDCARCSKQEHCDEIAMVFQL